MATKEQIGEALRRAHAAGDTESAQRLAAAYRNTPDINTQPETKAPNPYEQKSGLSNFLLGAGNAVFDQGIGAGQLLRDALPESLANSMHLPTAKDVDERRQKTAPLYETTGGKLGNVLGSVAPATVFPAGTIAKGLLSGAALGAVSPRGDGDSLIQNMTIGAAGGAIGHGAAAGIGRLLRPVRTELPPNMQALAEKAKAHGIDLTPAQMTGSKPLKWIDSVMDDLPLTAAKQAKFKELQHTQFNRALARTMGQRADNFGEDVMAHAKADIGGKIGGLADRNNLNFDYDTLVGVANAKFKALREYPDHIIKAVNNYVDDLVSKVEPNGTISGKAYRTFDSALGARIRNTTDGDLKHMLGELRDTVRAAMDKSISAADKTEWDKLRRQYANMKKLEPLAAKSTDGNISPALVRAAAIKKDANAAYRTNDLKDLGKIGQEFLKPLPSSGTAQRNFYTKMLTSPVNMGNLLGGGAGYLAGGPGGAAMGGLLSTALTSGAAAVPLQALMMRKAGQKYLSEGLLKGLEAYAPLVNRIAAPSGAYGLLASLSGSP